MKTTTTMANRRELREYAAEYQALSDTAYRTLSCHNS